MQEHRWRRSTGRYVYTLAAAVAAVFVVVDVVAFGVGVISRSQKRNTMSRQVCFFFSPGKHVKKK